LFLLLIIFVFDPLAIALVVTANFAFAQIRKEPEEVKLTYPDFIKKHYKKEPLEELKQRVKENQGKLKDKQKKLDTVNSKVTNDISKIDELEDKINYFSDILNNIDNKIKSKDNKVEASNEEKFKEYLRKNLIDELKYFNLYGNKRRDEK
jgi:peptidoglycan hydrolase CwlO-like protein